MPTRQELMQMTAEQRSAYYSQFSSEVDPNELYKQIIEQFPTEPTGPIERQILPRYEARGQAFDAVAPAIKSQTSEIMKEQEVPYAQARAIAGENVSDLLTTPTYPDWTGAAPRYGVKKEEDPEPIPWYRLDKALGAIWEAATTPQEIKDEQSEMLTATRDQQGLELGAQFRAQAIREEAKKRGIDPSALNQQIARQDQAVTDAVKELTTQKEQEFIQGWQESKLLENFQANKREGLSPSAAEKKAIQQTEEDLREYLQQSFPDRLREMHGLAARPEDVDLGFFSGKKVTSTGVYESPGATAVRGTVGLLTLPWTMFDEMVIEGLGFETDEFGNPLNPKDLNYRLYQKQNELFEKAQRGDATAIDQLKALAAGSLGFASGPQQRTKAGGQEERPITYGDYWTRVSSAIKVGRSRADNVQQIAAPKMETTWMHEGWTPKEVEEFYWGLGLALDLAAPLRVGTSIGTSARLVGEAIAKNKAFPNAIAQLGGKVSKAGKFIENPAEAFAVRLNYGRNKSLAAELNVDISDVPKTTADVAAQLVANGMFTGVGEALKASKAVKGQEIVDVVKQHLKGKQAQASHPELKRAVGAIINDVDEMVIKEGIDLWSPRNPKRITNATRLQSVLEENLAQAFFRTNRNSVKLMPTIDVMVEKEAFKKIAPAVNKFMKSIPSSALEAGQVSINLKNRLFAAAMKDEFYRPIVNKVSKGEKLSPLEANFFRQYVKREAYLNPSIIDPSITQKGVRSLTFDKRMEATGTIRELSTARVLQDISLGLLAKGSKAASQWVAKQTIKDLGGISGPQRAYLQSMERALRSAPNVFNKTIAQTIKELKESIPKGMSRKQRKVAERSIPELAFMKTVNDLAPDLGSKEAFYDTFLSTFFGGAQGIPTLNILKVDEAAKTAFLATPITKESLRDIVELARLEPGLATKGMRGGLIEPALGEVPIIGAAAKFLVKEDALVEAANIAAVQKIVNDQQAVVVDQMVRQHPTVFMDLKSRSLPDPNTFKDSLYRSLSSGDWQFKHIQDMRGAYKIARSVDDFDSHLLRAKEVGLQADAVIDDVMEKMVTWALNRFKEQSVKTGLAKVLSNVMEGKGLNSQSIMDSFSYDVFFRPEGDAWARFFEVWNAKPRGLRSLEDHPVVDLYREMQTLERGLPRGTKSPPVKEIFARQQQVQRSLPGFTGFPELEELQKLTDVGHKRLWVYNEILKREPEQAGAMLDYLLKDQAAYEIFRDIYRPFAATITANYNQKLVANTLSSLKSIGFTSDVSSIAAFKPKLAQIQPDIYAWGTPEFSEALGKLSISTKNGELDGMLSWFQRTNKPAGTAFVSTISNLLRMSRQAAIGGLLGGFGVVPVTRFFATNGFTAPFIQAVTTPGLVLKTIAEWAPATRRAIASEYSDFSRSFEVAHAKYVLGEADEVIHRAADGTVYTQGSIKRLMEEGGVYEGGLRADFGPGLMAAMKRNAQLSGDFKAYPGFKNTINQIFNPTGEGNLFTRLGFAMDSAYREAAFIAALKSGLSQEEAMTVAKNVLLDYGAVSQAERKVTNRAMMFYSFQRMNMTEMFKAVVRNPEGALNNIRRTAGLSRELKKEAETLYIEPTGAVARLYSTLGKTYDGVPTVFAGLLIPSLEALQDLGGWFNYYNALTEGKGIEATLGKEGQLMMLADWFISAPAPALIKDLLKRASRDEFFTDENDMSFVPTRMVIKLQQSGLWDTAQEFFDLKAVTNPRYMIAGRETVDGAQWRFDSTSGYMLYVLANYTGLQLGFNRSIEEFLIGMSLEGINIDPDEVDLKRGSDGNWLLYAAALQTPMAGNSLLRSKINRMLYVRKVLQEQAK